MKMNDSVKRTTREPDKEAYCEFSSGSGGRAGTLRLSFIHGFRDERGYVYDRFAVRLERKDVFDLMGNLISHLERQ